jgi:hypothetical protein
MHSDGWWAAEAERQRRKQNARSELREMERAAMRRLWAFTTWVFVLLTIAGFTLATMWLLREHL